MEKPKALIFDVLVDVVLKSGETFVGYIIKAGIQKEADRDLVKLANKKVTKGVRAIEKKIKPSLITSITKSEAKKPNF